MGRTQSDTKSERTKTLLIQEIKTVHPENIDRRKGKGRGGERREGKGREGEWRLENG